MHERYGRDRAALVAGFSTYRSRGAIRDLGKALGPAGRGDRAARPRRRRRHAGERSTRTSDACSGRRPRGPRWAWLARALPRGLGPAAPPLPASRWHGDLDPPADRLLPGRTGGDGGPADRAVGQGLLRRCRVPEDRPPGARDALGGRALRGADRADPQRASIDLSRIPFDDGATFAAIQRAETTGAFQIESRAQMSIAAAHPSAHLDDLTIQVAIVRPGPIVGGAVNPYISALQRLRVDPGYRGSLRAPLAGGAPALHARDDHLPGSGDRGRGARLRGLQRRRGRGPTAGHEPQALGGGDRAPPQALHRGRHRHTRRMSTRHVPSASSP